MGTPATVLAKVIPQVAQVAQKANMAKKTIAPAAGLEHPNRSCVRSRTCATLFVSAKANASLSGRNSVLKT
jgi:hypothetical protein